MEKRVLPDKSEKILLLMTTVFLCVMLGLYRHDLNSPPQAPLTVETEVTVDEKDLMQDMTPINLNTASAETLATLPGIGPALSERIVAYRRENGAFETVEELMEVTGIGEKKLEDIRSRVCVK